MDWEDGKTHAPYTMHHPQSDTFIGHRVLPAPNEAAWAEACAILSEVSPE